ncbi:MAG: type IV toxin-antitoxin system AbiEi family antitoxin domain-containing protein [Acidimicrobiia bacterium]|nr:type IV toxin-antitoxin system AbiEi family antitoxin domain-containing protein [Acidimicrobiia bacterium]
MERAALWRHLERHHGIISRPEAKCLEMTDGQIAYRLRSGEWIRLGPGVYRFAGTKLTWLGRARAEALSTGGLISHRAAATVWGIDGYRPGRLELVVPRGRALRRSSTRLHESTQFDRVERTVQQGVPVTGLARTVLDVAAVVGRRRLEWTIDAVLRQGLLDWPDLYQVLIRHSRRGRDGCGRLRALLDVRFGDTAIPDSRWNRMVSQLLIDAGLPPPAVEHEIYDGDEFVARVDLAYRYPRIAIELDSARHHLNRDSFEADPRRKNKLSVLGWTVLTFTWADYVDHPDELCATVIAARKSEIA